MQRGNSVTDKHYCDPFRLDIVSKRNALVDAARTSVSLASTPISSIFKYLWDLVACGLHREIVRSSCCYSIRHRSLGGPHIMPLQKNLSAKNLISSCFFLNFLSFSNSSFRKDGKTVFSTRSLLFNCQRSEKHNLRALFLD